MWFGHTVLLVVLTTSPLAAVKHTKIQSEIGKDFKLKCPEKQGVYGVEVEFRDEFLAKPKPFHEWQWTIYCRPFIEVGKEDKGDEDCEDKEPVPIAFNELVFEESKMNCDCNQYLAGITGKIDKEKYHGEADQQRRMISLRCCRKKNNFIEIRTCEMVGPKTLYFPEGPVKFNALKDWDVPDDFEFPKFFVTGVSIYENMMMVQQCRFAVLKHHKKAKELKKKIKDSKCDFFYQRDMMNDYSKIKKCEDIPVGWPRPMVMSNQDPALWSTFQTLGYKYFNKTKPLADDALLFSDQFTVCADGQIIYSVSKYVRFDQKAQKKDYIFLTKCAEFEKQPCMCKWNTTCDEKNWNKTCTDDDGDDTAKCQKYWSGFKSLYNKKTNKRKFEIFCCTSSSINFVDCNWTRWQNDTDVKMILPKPRIKSYGEGGVGDVVGFRDFRVKWEGKNMLVQYNICNTNDSGSPGCHYPCFPKLDQEKDKSKSDGTSEGDPGAAPLAALAGLAGIAGTPGTKGANPSSTAVKQPQPLQGTGSGTVPSGSVPAGSGSSSVPSTGGSSVPSTGGSSVPSSGGSSVPSTGGSSVPSSGGSSVPSSGGSSVPSTGGSSVPSSGGSSVPSSGGSSVPSTGGSSVPSSGGSSVPSSGGSSVPSTGGSSVPSSGGSSVPSTGGSSVPSTGGSSVPSTGGSSVPSTGGSSVPSTGGSSVPSTGGSSVPSSGGAVPAGSATNAPTVTVTPTPLPCAINLVIMMDSTHSLLASGYALEKTFVSSIISQFNFNVQSLGSSASRLTLLEFGDQIQQQIGFTTYTGATANADITSRINSLSYLNAQGTNIVGVLKECDTVMNSISASDTRPKVALLVTDGSDTFAKSSIDVILAAAGLQADIGIDNLFGVGIGSDAGQQVPQLVTANNYFAASTPGDLQGLVSKINLNLCTKPGQATVAPTKASTVGCPAVDPTGFPFPLHYSNDPVSFNPVIYPPKTVVYMTCVPGKSSTSNNDHEVTYHGICANELFRAFAIGGISCDTSKG